MTKLLFTNRNPRIFGPVDPLILNRRFWRINPQIRGLFALRMRQKQNGGGKDLTSETSLLLEMIERRFRIGQEKSECALNIMYKKVFRNIYRL